VQDTNVLVITAGDGLANKEIEEDGKTIQVHMSGKIQFLQSKR